MSTVLPMLRTLDDAGHRLQQLCQQLRRQGMDARLQALPAVPCLRFELQGSGGRLTCRVRVDDWARHHLPDLQGLDWTQFSPAQLSGLCGTEAPINWETPCNLPYQHARVLAIATAADGAAAHPQLQCAEGPVWIEHIEGDWPHTAVPIHVSGYERLPLSLRLGRIHQPAGRLRRLQQGDVLLLSSVRPQAWRAHRCLFDFTLQPESLLVTMIHPTEADQPRELHADNGNASPALDLASLPLCLDVVLATLRLSLAELSELGEGSVMDLPAGAYRQIRIEHDGQCVASGELVQIGDHLGVQLARAPQLK